MRRVIVSSYGLCEDDVCYIKPFEAYLIQFICNSNNIIYALVEKNDGCISSYKIDYVKFKYPTPKEPNMIPEELIKIRR